MFRQSFRHCLRLNGLRSTEGGGETAGSMLRGDSEDPLRKNGSAYQIQGGTGTRLRKTPQLRGNVPSSGKRKIETPGQWKGSHRVERRKGRIENFLNAEPSKSLKESVEVK